MVSPPFHGHHLCPAPSLPPFLPLQLCLNLKLNTILYNTNTSLKIAPATSTETASAANTHGQIGADVSAAAAVSSRFRRTSAMILHNLLTSGGGGERNGTRMDL